MNRYKQRYSLLFLIFLLNLKAICSNILPNLSYFSSSKDSTPVKLQVRNACTSRAAGLNCATAPLLCPSEFPYCSTLPNSNPLTKSFGCGAIENFNLIQFEAATTEITFRVYANNCTGGLTNVGNGIQVRAYEIQNCTDYSLKYCRAQQNILPNSNDTCVLSELVVGNLYYLMLDGYTADVCDYVIEIESGAVGGKPKIPASLISGTSAVCKNAMGLSYSIPNQAGAISYLWKTGSNGTITSSQNSTSINVNWGAVSDSVCVKVFSNCGESDWACKKVTMLDVVPSASKSGDLTCTTTSINIIGSASVSPSNAAVTYEWLNAANTVISTSSTTSVTQAGTYTLKVRATINGEYCEKTTTITVNNTAAVPKRPELQGDVIACVGKAINYNIINAQSGISKYNWVITNGTINSGATTPSVSATWNTFTSGKICVNAENNCGMSDTTCLIVNINKVPDAAAISGSTSVCPSAIATYSVTSPDNSVSYQWSVPTGASIQSGQGTSSINVNWGSSTGGNICVTPSNSCGTGSGSCYSVIVKSAQPDSIPIKGNTSVCPSETASYSVTPDATITQYTWIVPTNVSILSGQGSPSVTVRFNSGTEATLVLNLKNSCNLFKNVSTLITIRSDLPDNLPISGSTTVCSNDTTTYSVVGNSKITNYNWTAPAGAQILSGQGTMSVKIVWGSSVSGIVSLELTNSCQLKRTVQTSAISIKNADFTKPTISGSITNCPGTKATYSVPSSSSFTDYKWIIPTNASLMSGQGTNSIEVTWDNTGISDICVDITNDCNKKQQSCLTITVKTGIDSLPIFGPKEVCPGDKVVFTAQKDPDAFSYVWLVPVGSVITSGLKTNEIKVTMGANGGNVVVQPIGGCASDRSTLVVSLKKAPNAPATLTGKNSVCQGDIEKYTASVVSNALRYNWTVPAGATIVGADSTNIITVKWNTGTGGTISVKSQGECATSSATNIAVTVLPMPVPNAGADDSLCGKRYVLKGTVTSYDAVWSIIERPANAAVTFDDSKKANSGVTVSLPGKYVLKYTEQNGTCAASDTIILFFKDAPQLTLVDDACKTDGTSYNIKVNINSSFAPFTAVGLSGNFVGNAFASNAITDGTSYALVIKDATGCVSDTLKGKKICPCYTQAAVLKDKIYTICNGTNSKIEVQKDAILDGNDASEFVLHSGSTKSVGIILQRSATGSFSFDASKMQYGTTYYVHNISGNSVNGQVSSSDRCYSVSNGVSIVFKDKITVGLVGDTTICNNTNADLIFKTTDNGTFKISYASQTQIFSLSNIKNLSSVRIITSSPSTYRITEATDENGCNATISDSAKVSIRPLPTANAGVDKTVCQSTTTLEGTAPPQYKITWRSISGALLADNSNLQSGVSNLKNGQNIFVLGVKDNVCSNYQANDSVSIFLPILPKAINMSLDMFAGDTITAKVVEEAPVGTYTVTRLDNPVEGRFDLFSNGQFSYISSPSFSGIARFRFMICSEACNSRCDTGEVRILIKPKKVVPPEIELTVPNAITPNDDGKNDLLIIDNIEKFPKNELLIFNRWGDILYKSKSYNNDWNGTNQSGEPLPEGTYYYVLRLNINESKILSGDITILR